MQISKTVEQLNKSFVEKLEKEIRLCATSDELWKQSEGKSIHTVGIDPNRDRQVHRMEADRMERVADRIANMGIYAMVQGQVDNAAKLMAQAEETRRVSNFHRLIAERL